MRCPRTIAAIGLAAGLLAGIAACGTSGDDSQATTSRSEATTTAEATSTSASPTLAPPPTSAPEVTTTAGAADGGLPSCQELLAQYADAFSPDDLAPVVERFRAWMPHMPEEVAEAVGRLVDAYEQAGSIADIDLGNVDLTRDATTFSDWTSQGCPPR